MMNCTSKVSHKLLGCSSFPHHHNYNYFAFRKISHKPHGLTGINSLPDALPCNLKKKTIKVNSLKSLQTWCFSSIFAS